MYHQFAKNCNRLFYSQLFAVSHKSYRVEQRSFKLGLKKYPEFVNLGTSTGAKSRGFCTSTTLRENWLQHTRRLANPHSVKFVLIISDTFTIDIKTGLNEIFMKFHMFEKLYPLILWLHYSGK